MNRTIKSYNKFFESNNDDEFFEVIQSNFQELEDLGMIQSYNYGKNGKEFDGYPSIDKVNKFYGKESIWFKSLKDKYNCIIVNLRLPINRNEKIDQEGIKIFDDILSINSRLLEDGYKVEYDLVGSHTSYKPIGIIIYRRGWVW